MNWRPIATAPTDPGVPILGWLPGFTTAHWSVRVLRWNDHNRTWSDLDFAPCNPSHWMPLPGPPGDAEPISSHR